MARSGRLERRKPCPGSTCLLSVGLMDLICPPSTVFAAYNEIGAPTDLSVHPYTGHAVPAAHVERQLGHLRSYLR